MSRTTPRQGETSETPRSPATATPTATTPTATTPTATDPSFPARLVDALNGVFGRQQEGRAVHAKGIVLRGTFTPDPAAAGLSKAPHLQSAAVPLTVRFSNFSGVPTTSDLDATADPRGMALKLRLPDGSDTDIVAHSFNGFPVATAEEFRQMLAALRASAPGVPSPTPLELFFRAHPAAKAFFEGQGPPPVSYGTLRYFGVNSFRFTNASGLSTYGRYQIEPEPGEAFLLDRERAQLGPDYLQSEIRERIARGPLSFLLRVQVAAPGDAIADPSIAWPNTRKSMTLGTLRIDRVADDSDGAQRALLFTPGALPPGIAPADPMIDARTTSYPISYDRRHGSGGGASSDA